VTINTKVLFSAVIKALDADCICDIGSRDGDQAVLFRDLCPEAAVLAFEANPINFRAMANDARLLAHRIELFPFAVSDSNSTAQFHITDVDYNDPKANKGTSSLLVAEHVRVKTTVEVETRRMDEFVLTRCPEVRRVALWIDVEGVEFRVLEGVAGIKDRVIAVHVETAKVPLRPGQKTLADLVSLMQSYGFTLAGSNMPSTSEWGDVVFVSEAAIRRMGFRFALCKLKASAAVWLRADHMAVFLKERFPPCYRLLRWAYVKFGM
jgi:FkbM family methyltransferase